MVKDFVWVGWLILALFENAAFSRESLSVFSGLGGGYGLASGATFSDSPRGGQFLLSADLSYRPGRWVFDAGGGWLYSSLSGKTVQGQDVRIISRSGFLELSPRLSFGDRWQLGLVGTLGFGTDMGYAPAVGQNSTSYFIGPKAVYEYSEWKYPLRLWAQISYDLTGNQAMPDQKSFLGLVGVQIGIPITGTSESTPQLSTETRAPQNQGEVRVYLDPQKVFFSTASNLLKDDINHILSWLGQYLDENENQSLISIAGHADQRGKFQFNYKLSKKRAEAVRKALVRGGTDGAKVTVEANSYLKPIDKRNTPEAWAKNRRVEIVLSHLAHPEVLREKIGPLLLSRPWDAEVL